MDILRNSRTPDQDRLTFFKCQVLFWLLAASTANGKNFSIFIEPAGRLSAPPSTTSCLRTH